MTLRQTFLIGRAAVFATLLISAGATSISVAADAGDEREQRIAGSTQQTEIAQARVQAPVRMVSAVGRSASL